MEGRYEGLLEIHRRHDCRLLERTPCRRAGRVRRKLPLSPVAARWPDVLGTLMPKFEKATGNKVKLSSKGGPEIIADLKAGTADLVITNTEVVDELAKSGEVAGNGKTLLMISKVAVGVKSGAKRPDVSTPTAQAPLAGGQDGPATARVPAASISRP